MVQCWQIFLFFPSFLYAFSLILEKLHVCVSVFCVWAALFFLCSLPLPFLISNQLSQAIKAQKI
jgi:hypothetical protein